MDQITNLAAEGRKESSGCFTTDLLAAQRKLARVSELEPGLMLGKLVQAALVARATQIRFCVTAYDISAKINFPDTAGTDQDVQEYMATAFALAQGLSPRVLTWTCDGVKRSFVGRDQGEGPLLTKGMAVFRYEARSRSFWECLRSFIESRRDAHAILHDRVVLCPMPVFLDAARVNSCKKAGFSQTCEVVQLCPPGVSSRLRTLGPVPSEFKAAVSYLGDRRFEGRRSFGLSVDPRFGPRKFIIEGAERPAFSEHSGDSAEGLALVNETELVHSGRATILVTRRQFDWTNSDAYLSSETTPSGYPPNLRVKRWISLSDEKTESRLLPVQDGLLLNPVVLKNCRPGCRVVAPVHGLNCDLDQLNLLQDEAFQDLEAQLAPELDRLQELRASL